MPEGFEAWSASDDAHAAVAGYRAGHPFLIAAGFLNSLHEPEQARSYVTPESSGAWGDFEAVRARIRDDWGLASYAHTAEDAKDVAYTRVLKEVSATYRVEEDGEVEILGFLTHVWRPEFGFWMIHAFGYQLESSQVPRTSPGVAPEITP